MKHAGLIEKLLHSDEPSIRWKTRVNVLGEDPDSNAVRKLQQEIKECPRVRKLLSRKSKTGKFTGGRSIYDKWQGTHWILNTLADIGYPKDNSLLPIRDEILGFWLDDYFFNDVPVTNKANVYQKEGVPVMQGRHRRCASQQGNAL